MRIIELKPKENSEQTREQNIISFTICFSGFITI